MLGVSGMPVSDAVGKLGDLGDRLNDKTYAFRLWTHGLMIRLADRSDGYVYYTHSALRYDLMGIIPRRGFPCVWIPTIRFRMAVDAIASDTLHVRSTVRLVFLSCFVYCTPQRGLTDVPDLPFGGLYL